MPNTFHSSLLIVHRKSRNPLSVNHKLQTTNRKFSGFTLIELLIVIAIIGLLTSVGIVIGLKYPKMARDAQRKSDLNLIKKNLEIYKSDTKRYPETGWRNSSGGGYWIVDGGYTGSPIPFDSQYLKKMPVDPKNTAPGPNTPWENSNNYAYFYLSNNFYDNVGGGTNDCGANPTNSYILAIHLENSNDPLAGNTVTIGNGSAGCTLTINGWYTITSP